MPWSKYVNLLDASGSIMESDNDVDWPPTWLDTVPWYFISSQLGSCLNLAMREICSESHARKSIFRANHSCPYPYHGTCWLLCISASSSVVGQDVVIPSWPPQILESCVICSFLPLASPRSCPHKKYSGRVPARRMIILRSISRSMSLHMVNRHLSTHIEDSRPLALLHRLPTSLISLHDAD